MNTFGILRIVAAIGVSLCGMLAGAFALRDSGTAPGNSSIQAISSVEPPENKVLEKVWRQLDDLNSAEKLALSGLESVFSQFSKDLKQIHPGAGEVRSSTEAENAIALAREHIADTSRQLLDQREQQLTQLEQELTQKLAKLEKDLSKLSSYSLSDFESRLASILVLGKNRSVQGIEWIWVPDSGKTRTGGFWAAKSEIMLGAFSEISKGVPKSHIGREELKNRYTASAMGSSGPSDAEIKAQAARSVSNGRLSWGQIMSGNPGVQVFVPRANAAYNSLKAKANNSQRSAAAAAAEKQLAKYPDGGQRVASDSPSDAELLATALQNIDLPSSEWKYRLPTLQEWNLLKSAPGILGIGKPDFSEWVINNGKVIAVDMNWKAPEPKNPPEPGTVGFRLVLAAEP